MAGRTARTVAGTIAPRTVNRIANLRPRLMCEENTARVILVRASAFSSSEPRTGTCRRKYHDTSFQPLANGQDRRATSRGRRTAHGDAEVMAGRIRSRRMSVHSHG